MFCALWFAVMSRLGEKRKLLCLLIAKYMDDDDEEEEYLLRTYAKCRNPTSNMFFTRRNEGVFNMLINNHLIDNEEKFKAYFRFTREQFASILGYVEEDLRTEPYNRVSSPITAAEKLAVTLR